MLWRSQQGLPLVWRCRGLSRGECVAILGSWAGFGQTTHLSPQPVPSGLWAGEGAVTARSALAESCSGIRGVCRAPGVQGCAGGAVPPLRRTSVVSPPADKSQSWSPCGESAYSLTLIPRRFPSSRKYKPPSSIIHQVLNFIKEPPDSRAWCSAFLPGWESAGSGRPEGRGRMRVRLRRPRGGRSFLQRRQIQQGRWCLCFPFS